MLKYYAKGNSNMNKKQVLTSAVVISLASAVMAPSAYALNWKDGAPAKYHFTYEAGTEGIESVTCSDTNDTASLETLQVGETTTTQTGTIVWRDSYTNVTTFTVDVAPGYELTSLTGKNVVENDFRKNENGDYEFSFTDKGAEAWCFGKDVAFYLGAEKITYHFVDEDGNEIGSAKVGESIELSNPDEKEGYTFEGWYLDDQKVEGTFTADLITSANDENEIKLEAKYSVNEYPLTIHYYINNNDGQYGSSLVDTESRTVTYGTELTVEELEKDGYKVIGGQGITIGTENNVVNLVKSEPAEEGVGRRDYSFTYADTDAGIDSVTCSVDGNESIVMEKNETVKIETSMNLKDKTVVFTVKTVDGVMPVLNCDTGESNLTDNGDGTYSFTFTRSGYNNTSGKVPHVNFSLTTK